MSRVCVYRNIKQFSAAPLSLLLWSVVALATGGCSTAALTNAQQPTATAASSAGIDSSAPTPQLTATPSPTSLPSATPTPTNTATPTNTPTPTATPTPTLDLASCNVAGCGENAAPLPTVSYNRNLLLTLAQPQRRQCDDCPANEELSAAALDGLLANSPNTLARLQEIALSQQPYQIAPGVIYIVNNYVHHVVIDVEEPGFTLRNIIPPIPDLETQEQIRITPSYCFRPESLVVSTADYHGLVGSNRTEAGRELFYHLGRAALYRLDGRYDIDVIRNYEQFARTSISWGAGPIFLWEGAYDFNPEQEWFEPENLDYYSSPSNLNGKLTVSLSADGKYIFLTASYGITLEEHANNIIDLGRRWGVEVERGMRFDGTENAYIAIRLNGEMTPLLGIEEPLIVNCFAVETMEETAEMEEAGNQ